MSAPTLPRILLVDDDEGVLNSLQRVLRGRFDVTATSDAKAAIRMVVSDQPFAVVVSDLRMPGMDGISLLYLMRQAAPDTIRILLTGDVDLEAAVLAINQGNIFRFLTKPCAPEDLLAALEAAVNVYRSRTPRIST